MRNPFTPGAGYPPPYLAGRDEVLAAFERHLESSTRVPKHFVLTGLRGTGKTVTLREFQKLCLLRGWLHVERQLDETTNETSVMLRALATDLARVGTGASLALRLRRAGKRLVDTFKPKDLEAWGIKYSPAYRREPPGLAGDRLKRMLLEVMPLVTQAHAGLVFLYDEFHEVWDGRRPRQAPLATLFGAIKEVQLAGPRVIVVASGLPSVVSNIVKSRSYLERDLVVVRIDNLKPADARAAISNPLRRATVGFSDRLIDRIVTETRGYPYFLQYYCSFLIDSVPDQEAFDINVLEELRSVLLAELDASFFAARFAKLPKLERDALLGMARVGDHARIGEIPWKGKREVLRVLLARLVARGQLYRPSARGEVAFTLPLYRDFLMRWRGE